MNLGFDYFKKTNAFIEGNSFLRDLQRQSHKSLKEHLESDINTHKIIVLPTGSGKTGVIGLAPFGTSDGRVLVITPSLIIREGISDDFDTRTIYNFWTYRKVILNDEKLPMVYRYAGYNTGSDKKRILRYLENANIVIANIHKVYNSNSRKTLVSLLDPDFFDMIIIDEAHHSAADSWIKTLEHFNAKKIVKLTATPYRSDKRDLDGQVIYEYELADAISDGIVKNLVSEDYTTQKLEFIVDGKIVDKETAMEVMDKNWISRSVAYSKECSKTIVDISIKRLLEKRKLGNAHHQIIAVACSIEHAEEIKTLYEEKGLSAEFVSCDRQDQSEQAIINYKKGRIDVIVNVNMLGEGFDHPNISIAAIFRPFRTLAPYAQFIGRSLRKITKDNPIDEIDNVAHVVYHKELDLDDLWEFYTGEKQKASRKKIIESEYIKEEEIIRKRDVGEVFTDGELIKNTKSFLSDGIAYRYSKSIKDAISHRESEINSAIEKMKNIGLSDTDIDAFRKAKQQELDEHITNKREQLRDELIREELHRLHINNITTMVDNFFQETELNPKGDEFPSTSTNAYLKHSKSNDEYIMRYINYNLKSRLKRGIDEWETYDFKIAQELLAELINKLKEKI